MRIAIIADIHANFVALETVLEHAGSYDALWCLGDTVGYGPQPNECVARVQSADVVLVGNHDLGCLGTIPLTNFNREARIANEWNGKQLSQEHRAWLHHLKAMQQVNEQVTVAHGSPRDPVWEYLLDTESASLSFDCFDTQLCFVGHTHQPLIFTADVTGRQCKASIPTERTPLQLEADRRYIINPGSVGQPRDGDSRAAYAIYDTEKATVTFRRTAYNIKRTQTMMLQHGLPEILAARLSFGL